MRSASFVTNRTASFSSGLVLARSGILLAAAMLLCSALAFHTARAQLPTERVISGPCAVCQPLSVLVGDFDEDGTSDVVAGQGPSRFGQRANKVTFHPGTGSGTGTDRLGPATEIASSIGQPVALAKGDVTEDGHLDVVIVTKGFSSELLIVPGNGDGTFASPITVGTNINGPRDMAVADFNGDDHLDIVLGTTGGLELYPNESTNGGSAALGDKNTVPFGDPFTLLSAAHRIAVGDIGDDGDPDLAVVNRLGELLYVLGNPGTANLNDWAGKAIEFTLAHHVAFTTLNNFLSILVWSATTNSDLPNLAAYPGDGTVEGFGNSNRRDLNFTNNNVVDLKSFDANGDGNLGDAVEIGRDMVAVHPNFGSEFGPSTMSKVGLVGAGDTAIGDLDGTDGPPDIIGTQPREDVLSAGINDGDGGFPNENAEPLIEPPEMQIPERSDMVEVTSGKVISPIVAVGGERDVGIFEYDEEMGEFGAPTFLPDVAGRPLDVETIRFWDGTRWVIVGDEEKLERHPLDEGEATTIDERGPSTVESVGNLDDDDNDLADIAFSNDDGLFVGLQQDGGPFDTKLANSDLTNIGDVGAGKLLGADKTAIGREDIIAADRETGIDILPQKEDGTFGAGQSPEEFDNMIWNSPTRVITEDFNGDGLDGFLTNGGDAAPAMPFTNDGDDSFTIIDSEESQNNNDLLHGPETPISLGDVDGDGGPEFVRGGGFNEWFDNNLVPEDGASGSTLGRGASGSAARSTPVFGNPTPFASVPGVRSVAVADIDVDGDLDIVIASSTMEKVSWIENDEQTLPVELTSFEATQSGKGTVRLTWTTAAETYNSGFRVQHNAAASSGEAAGASAGASARGWQTIGRVEGAGTTDQPKSYQFAAEDLAPGTHQFRLEQIDLNGSTTTHDPITVTLQMEEALRLTAPSPNPVSEQATFSFAVKENHRATVTLYDVLGQRVATLYEGTPTNGEAQRLQLDTSDLSSGVYVLRLRANGLSRMRRVTVTR